MRFVASKFVTPKFQLLAEVNHQFNVDGGSARISASC